MVTGHDENVKRNKDAMEENGFYTQKQYERLSWEEMTSSMEDYLEMICRIQADGLCVRVGLLAKCLHVRPSSVSKMLENLRRGGYIDFRKYGSIMVTEKGREVGGYLLHRHEVLHDFFCSLNHTDNELEQVEKIEHFINRKTVRNMEKMIPFMKQRRGK